MPPRAPTATRPRAIRRSAGGYAASRPAPPSLKEGTTPSSRCSTETVTELLLDGFNPVVFCRFIDTAEYVAEHLAHRLGAGVRGRRGHRRAAARRAGSHGSGS